MPRHQRLPRRENRRNADIIDAAPTRVTVTRLISQISRLHETALKILCDAQHNDVIRRPLLTGRRRREFDKYPVLKRLYAVSARSIGNIIMSAVRQSRLIVGDGHRKCEPESRKLRRKMPITALLAIMRRHRRAPRDRYGRSTQIYSMSTRQISITLGVPWVMYFRCGQQKNRDGRSKPVISSTAHTYRNVSHDRHLLRNTRRHRRPVVLFSVNLHGGLRVAVYRAHLWPTMLKYGHRLITPSMMTTSIAAGDTMKSASANGGGDSLAQADN